MNTVNLVLNNPISKGRGIKSVFLICMIFFTLKSMLVYSGVPEFWKKSAFSFNGNETPLVEMLEEFALSFGVDLVVSPGVSGFVNGWHRANSGDEFLSRTGVKYQFQWFVFKSKLYVSPLSDLQVRRIKVNRKSSINMEDALKGVDLYEKKFGWGELKDDGVVLVTGPSKYVEFVRNLIEEKDEEKDEKQVMIFPLRHASVADREINFRNKKLIIPGAATILKKLFEGKNADPLKSGPGASVDDVDSIGEVMENSYVKKNKNIEIEGDVRTNSVLVRDVSKKRKFYEKVIREIDVEQKLVEIDAIIVDIDRQDLEAFGVDWSAFDVGVNNLNVLNSLMQLNQSVNGAATIEISDSGSFQAMLQALENRGSASVMANTSILTVENQSAIFDLSETQFIQTVGERVVDIEQVTAGTLLHVIPRNIEDSVGSQIQLVIDIEDGIVVRDRPDDLPSVKKITINTSAVVDEGRSLVVGGYNIQEDVYYQNKTPLLGDIPILGKAFTSDGTKTTKKERLFILTPRISSIANLANVAPPTSYTDSFKNISSNRNRNVANKVSRVFQGLARGEIPVGYEMKPMDSYRNPINCKFVGADADTEGMQYIVGQDLEIFIAVVKNNSDVSLPLQEELCLDNQVLAVSFWPYSTLRPEQETEIYMAKTRGGNKLRSRASLLGN